MDQGLNILLVTGRHRAQRFNLEQAGVGAVQDAREIIEQEVAADDPPQVITNAVTLRWVHDAAWNAACGLAMRR
jgi:hypothetical protein